MAQIYQLSLQLNNLETYAEVDLAGLKLLKVYVFHGGRYGEKCG